jgi:hypothetical protein
MKLTKEVAFKRKLVVERDKEKQPYDPKIKVSDSLSTGKDKNCHRRAMRSRSVSLVTGIQEQEDKNLLGHLSSYLKEGDSNIGGKHWVTIRDRKGWKIRFYYIRLNCDMKEDEGLWVMGGCN